MVGDWYLFEYHIEIRIYGAEIQPFLLPIFLTPRIFALEFIREILNSDYIHFVSKNHNINFKLKKEVGPFIVNNKENLRDAEKLLQEIGLQQGEMWIYDPHSIISKRRIEFGSIPYQHQLNPQLECLSNQDSKEDVHRIIQVQEQVSNHPSQSLMKETPQQFEKRYKRKGVGST
jgi:hypothetical protein